MHLLKGWWEGFPCWEVMQLFGHACSEYQSARRGGVDSHDNSQSTIGSKIAWIIRTNIDLRMLWLLMIRINFRFLICQNFLYYLAKICITLDKVNIFNHSLPFCFVCTRQFLPSGVWARYIKRNSSEIFVLNGLRGPNDSALNRWCFIYQQRPNLYIMGMCVFIWKTYICISVGSQYIAF